MATTSSTAVPTQKSIEYMSRRIGAVSNPSSGVDSKQSVIAEVEQMMADGWTLFATHFGGDNGAGIVVLHIFVK